MGMVFGEMDADDLGFGHMGMMGRGAHGDGECGEGMDEYCEEQHEECEENHEDCEGDSEECEQHRYECHEGDEHEEEGYSPKGSGCLDELRLPQCQELSPNQPRRPRPAQQPYNRDEIE